MWFTKFKPFLLSIAVMCGGLLWIFFYDSLPFTWGCPFKAVTGIPCPGCGGTRAADALIHGHWMEALYINPLSVLVFFFLCIAPVWTLIDALTGKNSLAKLFSKPWSKTALLILAVVILLNWIWNIFKGL